MPFVHEINHGTLKRLSPCTKDCPHMPNTEFQDRLHGGYAWMLDYCLADWEWEEPPGGLDTTPGQGVG